MRSSTTGSWGNGRRVNIFRFFFRIAPAGEFTHSKIRELCPWKKYKLRQRVNLWESKPFKGGEEIIPSATPKKRAWGIMTRQQSNSYSSRQYMSLKINIKRMKDLSFKLSFDFNKKKNGKYLFWYRMLKKKEEERKSKECKTCFVD